MPRSSGIPDTAVGSARGSAPGSSRESARDGAVRPSPLGQWRGRHDGEGPEHARWHERVQAATQVLGTDPSGAGGHIGIVGFRSDEGVRRNRGRVGAADGPAALRAALSPLALHGEFATGEVAILDHGDTVTLGEDLEGGQSRAAQAITAALDAPGNVLTVVLGGGHETAWASYRGLMGSRRMRGAESERPRWGVLNLDAHFDLRDEDRPTSGTPFLQMARTEQAAGRALEYAVIGISAPSNTGALFDRARELGVRWLTDVQCEETGSQGIADFVADFARDLDVLYLTIDLDLLPAAVAPGVSAPAAYGVPLPLVATAVRAAARTGKLALADVVELNPGLDQDSRTARTAARLIDEALRQATGGA